MDGGKGVVEDLPLLPLTLRGLLTFDRHMAVEVPTITEAHPAPSAETYFWVPVFVVLDVKGRYEPLVHVELVRGPAKMSPA